MADKTGKNTVSCHSRFPWNARWYQHDFGVLEGRPKTVLRLVAMDLDRSQLPKPQDARTAAYLALGVDMADIGGNTC